jgi:hypothetical protein
VEFNGIDMLKMLMMFQLPSHVGTGYQINGMSTACPYVIGSFYFTAPYFALAVNPIILAYGPVHLALQRSSDP